MATRSLGQLTLDLVARIGGFTGPLDQASRAAQQDMANIAASVKTASVSIAAVGTAATAAAAGIVAFTNNAAQNAREIKNQAAVANTSAAELQRMGYASSTVGVEQQKLGDILKDVNDRVGDFLNTGGGEMADFFEKIAPRIGVTAEQFRNLSGPQALQLFYDGLQKANLSQAEMTFYMESISDEATALIPLLRDGGAGFKEMGDEADRLGIVLSELEIARLEEFARQFDRLSGIFGSMSNILAAELAPYMSVLADELVEAAGGAQGLRESLPGAIRESVEAVGPLLDGLHIARTAVEALQAASGSVAQGYSMAFLTIQENATKMLDFIAGGLNDIIDGFNNLPGVDIPLIDSFNQSGYMETLREGYAEVARLAEEQRDQVVDLWNSPMPSEFIDSLIDQAQEKASQGITLPVIPTGVGGDTSFDDAEAATAAVEAQKDAMESYQALVASLRTDEEQLNQQLLDRLDILDAVKISTEEYQEMAARVADAAFSDAPEYGGLDAEVGGAFGELAKIDESEEKLQEWYETQLEMLDEYRAQRSDLSKQWDEQERQLKREHEDELAKIEQSRQMAQLVAAESVFSDLTSMARNFAGEQSGIYQAMFAVQKAAAIAQSVVAIQQGIAMAAANPWPANLAAMASVAAATAGIVSNISSITMAAGQAHDGIMSVPEDGTWNLKKGERVTTAETSAKLDRTLDQVAQTQQPAATGNQAPIVNLNEDASRAGQTSSRQQDDGRWVIDLVVANISGDGAIHKAMNGKYGVKTRGR